MSDTGHVVTVSYVVSGDADNRPSQLFSYENMLVAKIVLDLVLEFVYFNTRCNPAIPHLKHSINFTCLLLKNL